MVPLPANHALGQLLDQVHAQLIQYVAFPSVEAGHAATLWTAATHGINSWEHAPRLIAKSPEKRCGKSRLMDIVSRMSYAPLVTVNATVSAVVRSVAVQPRTLFLDEADTIFGTTKSAEAHEELRGLLNAGAQRGRPVLRCVGASHEAKEFASFSMAMLAAIKDLPDTIEDRAVVIRMRRRAPGEKVKDYRTRRDNPALDALSEALSALVGSSLDVLADHEPAGPLVDRAADVWGPLFAVADLGGGRWPELARRAAVRLVDQAAEDDEDETSGIRLLKDIRSVWLESVSFISSQDLVNYLKKLEESPWQEDENYLTPTRLGRMLRHYGIRSDRDASRTRRGYKREPFEDVWRRYLTPE